ncbi:MFS transporter [Frondihabitans sucicola]|uniref:MFS transporter n=1 Tax=Frondihabitans sucicola TaxID=1268041 RepID=A0ABM8GME8_9MICO|nr:MFS transporter [Frondihabitans sucicola]BDZ49597.1 MFS transporter [Frondihabitans sucicola]
MTNPDPLIVTTVEEAVASEKPPSVGRLLTFIFPATLGLIALFQGIQQILIPSQVAQLDPAHKVGVLALMTTFVAITSMIGIPLGGALSDRTRSRFGRRTPWILGTGVVSSVLMIAMGYSGNLVLLAVLYTALWLTSNMYQGAVTALLPDRVPEARRGLAASIIGLATPIGLLVGVAVAGAAGPFWGYVIIALVVAVTALLLVFGIREESSVDLPPQPKRESGTWIASVGHFLHAFADHDFRLAFISRFFLSLSYATATGFLYFTLSDYIGTENLPGHSVTGAVTIVDVVLVIGWVAIATFGGWLSDKLQRRKLFVGIAAVGLAVTMFIPIISPTWTGILVFALFAGIFIGTYFAVDLALMSLVLPDKLSEGRDLGILNVATGLPTILSGAVAGLLITFAGGYAALYVFGAICALISGVVVFFIRKVR